MIFKYLRHALHLLIVLFAFGGITKLLNANSDLAFVAGTVAALGVVTYGVFVASRVATDILRDIESI